MIWCDYACIEQDDAAKQALGIASLISYAARSDLIITPVQTEPTAMESFAKASHPTDLHNYGERAWCRLETYMFMCVGEILMRPIHYYGERAHALARTSFSTSTSSRYILLQAMG